MRELPEHERESFRAEQRVSVGNVKVQMRPDRRAARRSQLRDDLPATDALSGCDRDSALLKVLVERKSAAADVDRHIIPARHLRRDGRRCVVRRIVERGRNRAVGDRKDVRTKAI